MSTAYIYPLADPEASLETVGGKGASLARLANANLPVPDGFALTTAAYDHFVRANDLLPQIMAALKTVDIDQPDTLEAASTTIRDLFAQAQMPPAIAQATAQAYAGLSGGRSAVAVRSSATTEDLPDFSFAGQQDTYLNVQGEAAVLAAVKRCWASLWTARAIGYRMHNDIDQESVSLSVIVQLLVDADVAGIMFTANPITGRRDEVLISASWGLGEAIVSGQVTPDTVIVEKATGQIRSYEIADKTVMTVRVADGTEERSVPDKLRRKAALSNDDAAALAKLGLEIEALYEQPMDVEWALHNGKFAIVQARPITALPAPPLVWEAPNPKGRYMRASICELMPDPLSPLFETLGLPSITRGIEDVLLEFLHTSRGTIGNNFMLTINGYAYEGIDFNLKQWWQLISNMVPRFLYLLRNGVAYWQNTVHPHYLDIIARWREKTPEDLTSSELMAGIQEVADAFGYHLAALMVSTMGPTAGSEGIFTGVYEKLVMRPSDPSAPTFLMGFDSAPIIAAKALYDLAGWCQRHDSLAAYISTTSAEQLAAHLTRENPPENVTDADWGQWRERFGSYLEKHGYTIYDLDFMKPLPMEQPEPILDMLKLYMKGQAANPYERQGAYAERRKRAVADVRKRLKGLKRWIFEKALKWAQTQAPLREDGLTEIGRGYPILHRMIHELGVRFVKAGVLAEAEDIYWLEQREVEQMIDALQNGESLPVITDVIRERRALWEKRRQSTPPPMLPVDVKKYMGFDLDTFLPADESSQTEDTLKGVAASPGRVTATARVLHGPQDFKQMQPGDILVAGITTPAWTPLFAMAAGVVTDIGGPLSHGSIVAREYGIPAVLGTGVATQRIQSGQVITVDGSSGKVLLSEDGDQI
jgi:phosphohistidine swiveling domain-containing protein